MVTALQQNLLKAFPGIKDSQHFYFTGGTALSMFYLDHRKSEDLDFFTPVPDLIPVFCLDLSRGLAALGYQAVVQRQFNSFAEFKVSDVKESTIIHIALDAPFFLEGFSTFADYPGLRVNSLKDTAANKLLALFGRAAFRDFIDIYFLIRLGKFTKEELVNFAKLKDPGFSLYWLGVAFEKLRDYSKSSYDLSLLFKEVQQKELVSFFDQWREEINRGLAG